MNSRSVWTQPGQAATPSFAQSTTGPVFGQASQPSSRPFGQIPSQGQNPMFGQPSGTGQQPNPFASNTTGFVQNSSLGNPSPFSNPSQAISSNPPPNPFSNNSQKTEKVGVFGAPETRSNGSTFGQPSGNAPFGQPQLGNNLPQGNPFGATGSTSSAFGQAPAQPATNPFAGQGITGGTNPFTSNNTGNQQPGELKQSLPFVSSNDRSGVAVGEHALSNGARSSVQHPAINTYASVDAAGNLLMFKGCKVIVKDGAPYMHKRDGSLVKIWFPKGAPKSDGTAEVEDDHYNDDIRNTYIQANKTGTFENGVMPLLPPKREWCSFDF